MCNVKLLPSDIQNISLPTSIYIPVSLCHSDLYINMMQLLFTVTNRRNCFLLLMLDSNDRPNLTTHEITEALFFFPT